MSIDHVGVSVFEILHAHSLYRSVLAQEAFLPGLHHR